MKVFVAGATGALGTQLVPQLGAAGHDVIGMTRSPAKTDMLRTLGARPVVADALDPHAVARAVAETEPEVIVHQLTALKGDPGLREMRNPDRFVAMTNRPTGCAPGGAPAVCRSPTHASELLETVLSLPRGRRFIPAREGSRCE